MKITPPPAAWGVPRPSADQDRVRARTRDVLDSSRRTCGRASRCAGPLVRRSASPPHLDRAARGRSGSAVPVCSRRGGRGSEFWHGGFRAGSGATKGSGERQPQGRPANRGDRSRCGRICPCPLSTTDRVALLIPVCRGRVSGHRTHPASLAQPLDLPPRRVRPISVRGGGGLLHIAAC